MTDPHGAESELDLLRRRVAELEGAAAEPERLATTVWVSEAQFRALVAAVPGMSYRSDARPSGGICSCPRTPSIMGCGAGEHLGSKELDFGSRVFAGDRGRVEAAVAEVVDRALRSP